MADRRSLASKIGAGAAALAVSLVTAWEGYSPTLSAPRAFCARRKSATRKPWALCRPNANRARRGFFFCPAAVEVSAPERSAGNAVFLGDIDPRAPVCSSQCATGVSGLRGVIYPAAIAGFVVSIVVDSVYGEAVTVTRRQRPCFELIVVGPCFGNSYPSAVIPRVSGTCAPCVYTFPYPIEPGRAVAVCSPTVSDGRSRSSASARYALSAAQIAAANHLLYPASAHATPKRGPTLGVSGFTQDAPPSELIASEIDESRIFSHA